MWHLKEKGLGEFYILMWLLKSSTWEIWLTNEAEDVTNVRHEDNEQIDGKKEAHSD